jgi:hypothetical protein
VGGQQQAEPSPGEQHDAYQGDRPAVAQAIDPVLHRGYSDGEQKPTIIYRRWHAVKPSIRPMILRAIARGRGDMQGEMCHPCLA